MKSKTFQKIRNSINELKDWFTSEEMALIALNAGYENTVRDRLLYPLQKNFSDCVVRSEYPDDRKRADIAILNGKDAQPCCIIELKANYTFQLGYITGIKAQGWKDNDYENKNETRIESEFRRWRDSDIPLYCINLVTHLENIDSKWKQYLKYQAFSSPGKKKKGSELDYRKCYKEYLNNGASSMCETIEFPFESKLPFPIKGDLFVSIYREKIHSDPSQ